MNSSRSMDYSRYESLEPVRHPRGIVELADIWPPTFPPDAPF